MSDRFVFVFMFLILCSRYETAVSSYTCLGLILFSFVLSFCPTNQILHVILKLSIPCIHLLLYRRAECPILYLWKSAYACFYILVLESRSTFFYLICKILPDLQCLLSTVLMLFMQFALTNFNVMSNTFATSSFNCSAAFLDIQVHTLVEIYFSLCMQKYVITMPLTAHSNLSSACYSTYLHTHDSFSEIPFLYKFKLATISYIKASVIHEMFTCLVLLKIITNYPAINQYYECSLASVVAKLNSRQIPVQSYFVRSFFLLPSVWSFSP